MIHSTDLRRFARNSFIVATAVCALMLGSEVTSTLTEPALGPTTALAAAAGTAPTGSVELTPASGPLSTTLSMTTNPAPAFCPGDSVAGYRWQTFITRSSNDPATFTYNSDGPVAPSGAASPTFPLVSSSGVNQVNRNTGADTGNGGQITPIPGFDLSVYGSALPDGDYSIGFACTLNGATMRFWTTGIAVAAGSYSPATNTTTTTTTIAGTTTTTVAGGTTTTTVAGGTTTTTVAGGTTTTTVAGGAAQAATLSPAVPTAGGSYRVTHPNCRVGETITVTQPQSTPTSVTATCAAAVAGLVRPSQAAAVGTATVTFTAAPTTPGTYTVTSTGTLSGTRTATFVIVGVTSTSVTSSGGSPSGTSTGTIPATGSSTTSIIVWGILLLVFGRMAILFGRKPKVIPANR